MPGAASAWEARRRGAQARLIAAYEEIGRHCDGFIAFELGTMFAPFGKIYPLDTYRGLLGVKKCLGAKHSSLSRELEWQRLRLRNEHRPEFLVLTGNDLGIFMRDARDNAFHELTIRQSRNHGVFMAQVAVPTSNGWQLSPGTECTGNRFTDLHISNCRGKAFLVNDASCTNNFIASARFQDNLKGGLAQASLKPR